MHRAASSENSTSDDLLHCLKNKAVEFVGETTLRYYHCHSLSYLQSVAGFIEIAIERRCCNMDVRLVFGIVLVDVGVRFSTEVCSHSGDESEYSCTVATSIA